jgi:Holliday junction DNA helicase RuvA
MINNMIGRLEGVCAGTTPEGSALIDVGGVGYAVHVTAPTLARLIDGKKGVALFVHTAVREDAIDLYGFETGEELVFFKQLTSVSGIGPKSALGILNLNEVSHLKRTIMQGDATALTRVHGIGKKSAERIVVELRDKVTSERGGTGKARGIDGEVVDALMALGYRVEEARAALKETDDAGEDVSERVAAALKYLGSQHKR